MKTHCIKLTDEASAILSRIAKHRKAGPYLSALICDANELLEDAADTLASEAPDSATADTMLGWCRLNQRNAFATHIASEYARENPLVVELLEEALERRR